MKLSIIIVSYNSAAFLAGCLYSVENQLKNISHEIFVVDNASKDDSVSLVKEYFPKVKVIQNSQNLGFSKANNQAIRQAKGAYILLLNPDTVLLDNSIQKMIGYMDRHPQVGVAGPYLINEYGKTQLSYNLSSFFFPATDQLLEYTLEKILPHKTAVYLRNKLKNKKPKAVALVMGACLLTKKTVFDKVGLLDERIFMYGEDGEFCYRVKKNGFKVIFYPKGIVIHYGGESSRFLRNKRLIEGKGYAYYLWKHFFKPSYVTTRKNMKLSKIKYRTLQKLGLYTATTIFLSTATMMLYANSPAHNSVASISPSEVKRNLAIEFNLSELSKKLDLKERLSPYISTIESTLQN